MSTQHIGTTDKHSASPTSLATPQSPRMLQLWLEKEPIAIPQQRSYVASVPMLVQPQRRRRPRKETLLIPNLNVSLSLSCGSLASSSIFRASESWSDLQMIVMQKCGVKYQFLNHQTKLQISELQLSRFPFVYQNASYNEWAIFIPSKLVFIIFYN